MRPLYQQWFSAMLARLQNHDDKAKNRLAEHWGCKLDEKAKQMLYRFVDYHKVCYTGFLYIAERYICWFFNESSSQWEVYNPSAALVWMLRWTFWYDHDFYSEFLDVDF